MYSSFLINVDGVCLMYAFLNRPFLQMSKLNSLFRDISFLELPKYSRDLQVLRIIEKFKNWKILLKNSWKIGKPFGRQSWKIGTPLASWHVYWNIGTLARKNKKLARFWHVGRLVHGYVDHAGMHGTYGMQFSSHTSCESVNVTMKTTINFYDMKTLRYLVIKEKFE